MDPPIQSGRAAPFLRGDHTPSESTVETVMQTIRNLPGKGYQIYADSYFGSFELIERLAEEGHAGTVTCRRDRPSWIFTDFLDHHESQLQAHGNFVKATGLIHKADGSDVHFTAWIIKAKRTMRLISTAHNSETVQTEEESRVSGGRSVRITCTIPRARQDYKLNGGFVDRANQGLMTGRYRHRLYRWRIALLLWFLKLVVHNAYVLYKAIQGERMSESQFIAELARQLSPIEPISDDMKMHSLSHLTKEEHCKVCFWMRGIRSSTPYFCEECGAAIHPSHTELEHSQFFTGNVDLVRKRNFSTKEREFTAQAPAQSRPNPPRHTVIEPITVEQVEQMTRSQLRRECKKRGLVQRGTPDMAKERLKKWINENEGETTEEEIDGMEMETSEERQGDDGSNDQMEIEPVEMNEQPSVIDPSARGSRESQEEEVWHLFPSP